MRAGELMGDDDDDGGGGKASIISRIFDLIRHCLRSPRQYSSTTAIAFIPLLGTAAKIMER